MKRCIKCERLWKELSDAAMAYVRIYCEHERLIELQGADAHYLSKLVAPPTGATLRGKPSGITKPDQVQSGGPLIGHLKM